VTPSSNARALWFGPEERPLFGWMHTPDDGPNDGEVRGAVVLCPPLGLEGVCSDRAFRRLAEAFAGAGMTALRFDYDGTGDSAGRQDDPGRVAAWSASVRSAVELVKASGAARVVVVGMRVGATVAACELADGGGVDGIVLWDPCASGRSYLREQQALGLFSVGGGSSEDGSVEVPGIVFGAETVGELGSLSIAGTEGPIAPRVLVLVRPERAANKAMRTRLEMDHVEWGEAEGQADFVDVEPFEVREPLSTMDAVVSWVSEVIGTETSPFSVPARGGEAGDTEGRSAIVDHDENGGAVVERIVSLGQAGLFGIVTEPSGPVGQTVTQTVILLNAGIIDHVGPSRLWVDFARRWAGGGVRVLRFDLSGLGDSPTRPGQVEDEMYPPEAFDDLAEVVAVMAPDGPGSVVLAGLCSGGYHSIEGGIALGLGGVCVINPILTARPSEIHAEGGSRTPEIDSRRQATTARRRWVRALPAHDLLGSIVDRLPDAVWWIINRVAVGSPPGRIIEKLVDSGVETYVVCGDGEARVMRRGQAAAFRRLARSGRFHLEVMPGIDHELFARASRDRVGPVVTERILRSVTTTEPVRRP
jgi:alpha-beta hydrolase superfamily lysophospholipase